MDKLFNSTFDFLSYALPGSLLLLSSLILSPQISAIGDFVELAAQVPFYGGIIFLILGYTLGFAFYPIGRSLYKSLGFGSGKKHTQRSTSFHRRQIRPT